MSGLGMLWTHKRRNATNVGVRLKCGKQGGKCGFNLSGSKGVLNPAWSGVKRGDRRQKKKVYQRGDISLL